MSSDDETSVKNSAGQEVRYVKGLPWRAKQLTQIIESLDSNQKVRLQTNKPTLAVQCRCGTTAHGCRGDRLCTCVCRVYVLRVFFNSSVVGQHLRYQRERIAEETSLNRVNISHLKIKVDKEWKLIGEGLWKFVDKEQWVKRWAEHVHSCQQQEQDGKIEDERYQADDDE
jgi:hypothetical protein